MEKKETKRWYVQPEVDVIDVKFETELLQSTGATCMDKECTLETCTDECGDDCFDDE